MFLHPTVGFNAWQARAGNSLMIFDRLDGILCADPEKGAEKTVAENCKRVCSF